MRNCLLLHTFLLIHCWALHVFDPYQTKQGELADRLVHSMYLETFMQQAAYLMDWGFLQDANASFWQQYVVDGRMPSSPSRRTGVGPKCSSCDRQGMFRDIYTKQQVRERCCVGCGL